LLQEIEAIGFALHHQARRHESEAYYYRHPDCSATSNTRMKSPAESDAGTQVATPIVGDRALGYFRTAD
jgi:hypothetical protein